VFEGNSDIGFIYITASMQTVFQDPFAVPHKPQYKCNNQHIENPTKACHLTSSIPRLAAGHVRNFLKASSIR
jgi:hypothetical protein